MSQPTSNAAYAKIVANGLITGIRFKVYDAIANHGPITMNEVFKEHLTTIPQATQTPRYAELVEMGVIAMSGKRPDRHSNVEGVTWEITANLPTKLPKRLSKDQQIEAVRQALLDIHWRVKNNVAIDLPTFEQQSKDLLELLRTGIDTKESL